MNLYFWLGLIIGSIVGIVGQVIEFHYYTKVPFVENRPWYRFIPLIGGILYYKWYKNNAN